MSMHMAGPALNLAGKKKGKQKWASAAAKQQAQAAENEWANLVKKWEPTQVVRKVFKTESVSPAMSTSRIAGTARLPSRVTPGGECTKKEPVLYTGTKIIGIATMHKSNLVPIFSDEEAVAVASMRR